MEKDVLLALIVVVPSVFGGCIDTGDVTTGNLVPTPAQTPEVPGGGLLPNASLPPGEEFFVLHPFTGYFTADHAFSQVRPDKQVAVPIDGLQEFSSGSFPHPWFTNPTDGNIHYVEPMKVSLTFTTDKVVTLPPFDPSNPEPLGFLFAGWEDNYIAGTGLQLPYYIQPGQMVTVTAQVDLPRGGFMFERGNRGMMGLAVLSSSVGSGGQGAQLQLVTGGPQASFVTGSWMSMPFNTTDTYPQSGNLAKVVNATDPQPQLIYEFLATNETRRAAFTLTYRGTTEVIPYMWVSGPDGRQVMSGNSPVQTQKMTLYGPNFHAGGFGIYKVYFGWDTTFGGEPTMNFGFDYDILTHVPPPPPPATNQTASKS